MPPPPSGVSLCGKKGETGGCMEIGKKERDKIKEKRKGSTQGNTDHTQIIYITIHCLCECQ